MPAACETGVTASTLPFVGHSHSLAAMCNAASALANYKKALALGGSRPLPELFETAGIRLDLSANVMQELAHETERALDALPV